MIAEYQNGAAPSAPTREYIYSGGSLLAKIESGAVQYYHPDQLSVRLMTDSNGNVIGQQAHYPFGESWFQTSTTTKWFFTSYERDAESGNDYAMARYGVNRLGRFASPDPITGSPANPQSINRYAYVRDDPVNLVDPLGLTDCDSATQGQYAGCEPGNQSNNSDPYDPVGGVVYLQVTLEYLAPPEVDVTADAEPVDVPAGFDPMPTVGEQQDILTSVTASLGAPSFDPGTVGEEWGGQAPSHGAGAPAASQPQTGLSAQPPQTQAQGSGDVPVGMDIWHNSPQCPGCGDLWGSLPNSIYEAYGLSVIAGAGGYAAYDVSLVEEGNLFGTRYLGNDPLFNSNSFLRVGWGYSREYAQYVFRIGGSAMSWFLDNPHINLWPPSWWGGPPGP